MRLTCRGRMLSRTVAATAERTRAVSKEIREGRFQRGMALIAAFFAVLSGGEAYFEHLRGSYNQRLMWTPVWLTPPTVGAAVGSFYSRRFARAAMPFVSVAMLVDGALGFFLHLRGIYRMPGRFRNFRFNMTIGPPLFAPLLFCAVGMLGLLATFMRRERR